MALVTDTYGNPVSGVTVTFTRLVPGPPAPRHDRHGVPGAHRLATFTTSRPPPWPGLQPAASATGTWSVNFTQTNTAGTAAALAVVSGSGQSAPASTAFATPLAAKVTDTYANPVSGVSVTFRAPSTGASASFAPCATNPHAYSCLAATGTNGEATSSAFTANPTTGGYTITAGAPGTNTVTFAETNTATGPAAIAVYRATTSRPRWPPASPTRWWPR